MADMKQWNDTSLEQTIQYVRDELQLSNPATEQIVEQAVEILFRFAYVVDRPSHGACPRGCAMRREDGVGLASGKLPGGDKGVRWFGVKIRIDIGKILRWLRGGGPVHGQK